MKRIGQTVWVCRLAPSLWLHTTTAIIAEGEGVYFPANGLILESKATHFHRDRTGGIPALQAAGIPTVAHPLTCELARSHGTAVPTSAVNFIQDTARLSAACELFFPGAGHTRDNIVVWLPHQRVLFGGCFLKSVTSPDLGNLADAVVADWAGSAQRVRARYPAGKITVPGHGTISGDPVGHTLALLVKEPAKSAA